MTGWDWFLMGAFLFISKLSLFMMIVKYMTDEFILINVKIDRLHKLLKDKVE